MYVTCHRISDPFFLVFEVTVKKLQLKTVLIKDFFLFPSLSSGPIANGASSSRWHRLSSLFSFCSSEMSQREQQPPLTVTHCVACASAAAAGRDPAAAL